MASPLTYMDLFSTDAYLKQEYGTVSTLRHLFLAFFHKLYVDDIPMLLPEGSEPCQHRRVLDIGCGPTVINQFSASRWADEIVMADLKPECLEEVRRWKEAESGSYDWTPFARVVAMMEDMPAEHIESRLRSKISNIVHCDLQQDPPLDQQLGLFDVIFCGFCLCTTSKYDANFRDLVTKISNQLKPGGIFITLEALGEKMYPLGEDLLPTYSLREDFYRAVLRDEGFSVSSELVVPQHFRTRTSLPIILLVGQKAKPPCQ